MEDFDYFKYSFCDTCKVTKEEWKKEVARLKRRYTFLKQKVLKNAHLTLTALSDSQSKLEIARSENKRLNEENSSVRERLKQKLLEQVPLEIGAKKQKESLERLEADLKRAQDQGEAALQHNRQLNSLVADRDLTIKKLRENTEELKGSIAALKKELSALKAERENLLKKNLKTVHHSIKLCEILRSANLLPKYYKVRLLRQWKKQVNCKKSSDGELLERILLSPDGVNSLCSQDTGFDSEEFCDSDSDRSVRNEGIGTEDSFHHRCPSPLREETVVEESEQVQSVRWHSTSAKGSVVCSVEKTSRTSREVFKVNEDSTLLSIFDPSDSEVEELSLILARTKSQPPLSPIPATPIREICRTSVDVARCSIVETSGVAVDYDKVIRSLHSEETQTDLIFDTCLSCLPKMSQNTVVPDGICNMIQSSSCKETQTERLDVSCFHCASGDSRSSVQVDKDPSCAQFRTYNSGMIRVDYLQKDNQPFSGSPSCDGSAIDIITEDVDVKVVRTVTTVYETECDPEKDDDRQCRESSPGNLAQLPWRTQIDEEPPTLSDGLGASDGENSLHLLSDGGGMYNSMLDSRDTEEIRKYDRRLPSRRFRTEIHDNSEVSENENSVILSVGGEVRENEMDDVSVGKHIQRPNKYKRMKLTSANVDKPYDSDECWENMHTARLRSRRGVSANERTRHAFDQPEGMNQRERRYDSPRLHTKNVRSYVDSRPKLSKQVSLGTRNSHNTAKLNKHVINDFDGRVDPNYTRAQTQKITRHLYSPRELGKCQVSKYQQNQRVGVHRSRSKDADIFSLRSASPDSGTYVMYNSNLDSDSHHSLHRRHDPVTEKYGACKYQKGRNRNVWVRPASSKAAWRSTWNDLSDEAEERDSDNLSDQNVHDPEVLLIVSSDEEERYTGQNWRRSFDHKSSYSSSLPKKVSYLNQKYMRQSKKGNESPEIKNRVFSLVRLGRSEAPSSQSQSPVSRMFEKKKGETDEHCCHLCICPSIRRDWHSQQQTVLQELRSCLATSSKNSTLTAKKKCEQNRINKRKCALQRKRRLQDIVRQQIVANRKAWLNKQSLSSQECGNSVQISSQSASTSSHCLETIIEPECNISLPAKQGMNITEGRSGVENGTDVGENGAGSDENNLHRSSNANENVEKCVSSSKSCSEENVFGSDLESVGSSSPTDPNISVPCDPNVANDVHGKVTRVAQINNSRVSHAGNMVEKPLVEDSVDRHNFSSVLGLAPINTPPLPASKVHCDPLVYRCDISPIKNSDGPVTPIKNSQVDLLSSTQVSAKSNDVHSSPEANNDRPLGLQKELLNNLDFMNYASPLQKSSESAILFDCSAVNKPIKDISNITADTNLATMADLLDHSSVNGSSNRDLSHITTDTNLAAEANLFDSSAINKSPNKVVSNITTDPNLTAIAVSTSPNKDVSSIISAAIGNVQLNSENCDSSDVSLLTSDVIFSTRVQTNLPVAPVRRFQKEILTKPNPSMTKIAPELVNKKSFDCNSKSPIDQSRVRSVNKNIFGSDLESLDSSDSEDEQRSLRSKLPSPSNQIIKKSVEASFDQKKTSFNSKPSDREVVNKQIDKLCSKKETSEFAYAGMKERDKISRTCHNPPPVLTDERASPLLNSSIACPTVRRIAHQPKTYSALRKTRSLETANVNKTSQGNMLAVDDLPQSASSASDLLAPCPFPPKQTTKLLCKPQTVKKIVKPGKKMNKAMAQAKKIAECYKVPKLLISAASTEADAGDSDGKRLYISSVVPPAQSPNVVSSEVKDEKSPKLTVAALKRLRAAEMLKIGKIKPEAQARHGADSLEGTITQGEINKSKVEKVVDADKVQPEKDHCVRGEVLVSGNTLALASKEIEPPEVIIIDQDVESSGVKVNNKRESCVSLDSVVRGRRSSGRKSVNSCSKPLAPTNDAELADSSSVTEGSTLKGGDKSTISPASPEISASASPLHKPSVIPASPMNQCDSDSSAVLSPPPRRCVQVLRLAMNMCSAERQTANLLAKQRPSDKIRAEEKSLVSLALDVYLAGPFDSEALSYAVQKLVNVSDVKVVAKCVMRYAADDKSEIVADPPAPPLSNNLKRLITLVLALQREGPRWQILTEHVLGGIEHKLFRLGHSASNLVNQATKLTLLHTSLCRILPDRFRVQNFCLMALYSLKFKAHAVIYTALTVLPEALPMADVGNSNPLVHCIVYLLLHHTSKYPNPIFRVVGLKNMLNKVFGYKSEIETPQCYAQSLFDKLKRGCLEVSPAIILLAKRKEWYWTLKYVLNTGLEPILEEWERGTVSELIATEAVKLIGYILKCFPQDPNQSKAKVMSTIKLFEKLLLDNSIDSHAFKETVASALVCLSRFQFLQVVAVLKRWQPKQPVSRNLLGHLQVLMHAKSCNWWSSYLSESDKSPKNNEVDKGAERSEVNY